MISYYMNVCLGWGVSVKFSNFDLFFSKNFQLSNESCFFLVWILLNISKIGLFPGKLGSNLCLLYDKTILRLCGYNLDARKRTPEIYSFLPCFAHAAPKFIANWKAIVKLNLLYYVLSNIIFWYVFFIIFIYGFSYPRFWPLTLYRTKQDRSIDRDVRWTSIKQSFSRIKLNRFLTVPNEFIVFSYEITNHCWIIVWGHSRSTIDFPDT